MLFFNFSAFYFFYFSAVGVYVIFLPKVLNDIGYSAFEIGIIFAIAPLMRFITPFLFLKYVNLNQNIFKISLYCSVLFSIFFYFTIDKFYLFIVNNALLAICLSIILPYLEVSAIKNLGKDRYGKSRLYGSLGFIFISLVLAKFLIAPLVAIDYYLIVNVLTVIFAFFLLKYDVEHKEQIETKSFCFFKYFPFWISLFFMQVSFGSFYNFFTIYEEAEGISLEVISYLWSFGVICEVLMLYFQAPILKNNLLTVIKICVGITILRWLILYFYPDNLMLTFISQAMHAFSFGLYHSSVIIYLYSLYSNKKLAQQFMYGVAYGLGGFVGALVAGFTYGKYLFLYSAFFALVSFISLYFIREENFETV